MKKIAVIYSYNTQKTANVAKEIVKTFDSGRIEEINAEEINGEIFTKYDYLVLGIPTWFDGELPNYWDEFMPELETLDLSGKKIALFGNGDQKGYPENFVDAIGLMANIVEELGAKVVGFTSSDGYKFEKSNALRGNQFVGLAIDFENQSELNTPRIKAWVEQLKKEFV